MLRRTGLQGNAMTYKKQLVTKAKLQLTAEYQSSTTALDSARASKSELLLVLVLVAAVLAVYLPVRQYPFFSVDDYLYIADNPHVQTGLNWSTLKWALTDIGSGEWHPLTWLSHALDCQIFGLRPGLHHEVNVLLHAINAVLLFWVLFRATGCRYRSFAVASLFALHPMNVEPVVWLAERKTLLSTLFFLLALDAYRRYIRRPGDKRYYIVGGLFLLGLMCKPQVIMLPFVLVLWDYWPLGWMLTTEQSATTGSSPLSRARHGIYRSARDKLPIFSACACYALFVINLRQVREYTSSAREPLSVRLATAIISYARYLERAFWPMGLAPSYTYPGRPFLAWEVWAASACLLLIIGFVAMKSQYKYLLVGWCWFVVTLLPMIGIIQGPMFMADRYAYISFIGIYIMVSWGLADLLHNAAMFRSAADDVATWLRPATPRWSGYPMIIGSSVVLLALGLGAHRQVRYWSDELTLWSHAAQVSKDNWFVEHELGQALILKGKQADALNHLNKALLLNPKDPYANIQRGFWEYQHGNLSAAIPYYKLALANAGEREKEIKIKAATNLGLVYRSLGDFANANQYLARAAEERGNQ